ncbi:twin-arginine translocation signal domain-containing protein [Streptomyces sp. NPDC086554]|uniref:twin-arginine translocation signal domain-containing protein n=1 Tax=Streptomyces sp. NPDC086554 TaxID=3154864 RepID=UPI00344528EC
MRGVSRRTVLTHAGIITAAAAVTSLTPSVATAAPGEAPKTASAKVPTSANGWSLEKEANHVSTVWTRPVPGTSLKLDIRIGDAEAILLHVIRRFHYEVEQLHPGDLVGWQRIDKLSENLPESNLASGTAVRIRPGAAAKGSMFPLQEIVVRDILADCESVVRWGGDDNPVDEALFYLDRSPDSHQVRDLARKLRQGEVTAGQGAGTTVDPLSKARRERAQRLARQQTNR